jgi:hypothetical protein
MSIKDECVADENGVLWWLDAETESVYTIKEIDVRDIPPGMVVKLMKLARKRCER